ncbi:MAG: ATP-grasp domain-containing protein, partial [Oscillospiraceae bacterium]|nr:ATP-grasp domain-containing protein [Oscillospiraceae bacterium]
SAKKAPFAFGASADERYTEPTGINGEEYTEWCLDFCKKHSVDVFFVKRFREETEKYLNRFISEGIHVIADGNTEQNRMLGSKFLSCSFMKEHDLCLVPHMELITDAGDFERAYRIIKEHYGPEHHVCIKADRDEGGLTYRRLYDDDTPKTFSGDIYFQAFAEDLKSREKFSPMVIMPYLDEPEISIDCMSTPDGLIAVPRRKIDTRITELRFDTELIETAKKISETVKIEYPYNIQLRPLNGRNVFMEINTRMAGGCYKAGLIGCNFPQLAVSYALDDRIDTEKIISGFKNVMVGEVAAAVIV